MLVQLFFSPIAPKNLRRKQGDVAYIIMRHPKLEGEHGNEPFKKHGIAFDKLGFHCILDK